MKEKFYRCRDLAPRKKRSVAVVVSTAADHGYICMLMVVAAVGWCYC